MAKLATVTFDQDGYTAEVRVCGINCNTMPQALHALAEQLEQRARAIREQVKKDLA